MIALRSGLSGTSKFRSSNRVDCFDVLSIPLTQMPPKLRLARPLSKQTGYLSDNQSLTADQLVSKEMVATTLSSQPSEKPLRAVQPSSERSVPQ